MESKRKVSDEEFIRLAQIYDAEGISRRLNINRRTVYRYAKRLGVEIKRKRQVHIKPYTHRQLLAIHRKIFWLKHELWKLGFKKFDNIEDPDELAKACVKVLGLNSMQLGRKWAWFLIRDALTAYLIEDDLDMYE